MNAYSHIRFVMAFAATLTITVPTFAASAVETKLAPEAVALKKELVTNCKSCHIGSGDEVTKLGDFSRTDVLKKLINFKNFKKSKIYQEVDTGNMPKPDYGDFMDDEGKKNFLATLEKWVKAGAPSLETTPSIERTYSAVLKRIAEDFEKRKDTSLRYVTFTSSGETLKTAVAAVNLALNHVSFNPVLSKIQLVDPQLNLYRFKLTDYDIRSSTWDQMAGDNPFRDEHEQSEEASTLFRELTRSMGARLPLVHAEWLINTITQPPNYNRLLGLPGSLSALERLLEIDTDKEIRNGNVLMAGFNQSGVSFNNRVIERFTTRYGYLWRSYDFKANFGRRNIFDFPVSPEDANASRLREFVFTPDGGEMIFSLPNGLQGYFITNQAGAFLNPAPIDVVTDPARFDRQVTNGVSCMRCHGEVGIISKGDQIFSHFQQSAETNPRFSNDRLADSIRATYGREGELKQWFSADSTRFLGALKKLGIERENYLAVQKSIDRYLQPVGEQDLKLELMISDEVWNKLSDTNGALRRVRTQASNSLLKRDFMEAEHRDMMREVRDFNRAIDRGRTPQVAEVPSAESRVERISDTEINTVAVFGRGLTGAAREADVIKNAKTSCAPRSFRGFVGACRRKPSAVVATPIAGTLEISCQAQCK